MLRSPATDNQEVHHHKHRPIKEHNRPTSIFDQMRRLTYLVLLIMSLLVIGVGVATLAKGRLGYYNYQHLTVFAPFAIVVGLVLVWVTFALRKRAQLKPGTKTEPDNLSSTEAAKQI
jgi:hypothetical protein